MLLTPDAERIDVQHDPHASPTGPAERRLAIVFAHGFCGSWRNPKMRMHTPAMRRVHHAILHPLGRVVSRTVLRTRIASEGWQPPPEPPIDVVSRISPTPLLVVHGLADRYLPSEHGEALHAAARDPKELWLVEGFGHAERGATPALADRLARWILAQVDEPSMAG
jgi:hypothetical protein